MRQQVYIQQHFRRGNAIRRHLRLVSRSEWLISVRIIARTFGM